GWLAQAGNVAETEMLRTFNCGMGFIACVAAADVDAALAVLRGAGEAPVVIGEIVPAGERALRSGQLFLTADYQYRLG
ncbi:MAG TPA: AIR synthase-related protein, partial [Pseudomonadales bacterium]|nr:AIR synthase-related protein [Pseudomonadales bacterium]